MTCQPCKKAAEQFSHHMFPITQSAEPKKIKSPEQLRTEGYKLHRLSVEELRAVEDEQGEFPEYIGAFYVYLNSTEWKIAQKLGFAEPQCPKGEYNATTQRCQVGTRSK